MALRISGFRNPSTVRNPKKSKHKVSENRTLFIFRCACADTLFGLLERCELIQTLRYFTACNSCMYRNIAGIKRSQIFGLVLKSCSTFVSVVEVTFLAGLCCSLNMRLVENTK
jgi:hypothetical protein